MQDVGGDATDGADAGCGRGDVELVQLADEDATGARRLGGEELELAGLVILAEIIMVGDRRGLARRVADGQLAQLGEATELAAGRVVPAVSDATLGDARPW